MIRKRILAYTPGLVPYCVLFPVTAYRFRRWVTTPHPTEGAQ